MSYFKFVYFLNSILIFLRPNSGNEGNTTGLQIKINADCLTNNKNEEIKARNILLTKN